MASPQSQGLFSPAQASQEGVVAKLAPASVAPILVLGLQVGLLANWHSTAATIVAAETTLAAETPTVVAVDVAAAPFLVDAIAGRLLLLAVAVVLLVVAAVATRTPWAWLRVPVWEPVALANFLPFSSLVLPWEASSAANGRMGMVQ